VGSGNFQEGELSRKGCLPSRFFTTNGSDCLLCGCIASGMCKLNFCRMRTPNGVVRVHLLSMDESRIPFHERPLDIVGGDKVSS
jgi:hypothetical protein